MHVDSGLPLSLQDTKVDTKIKLSALWITTMFLYVYGDYFELYVPGKLSSMIAGNMVPLGPVTQGMLVGTSTMLAIQAIMIFFSLVAPPPSNRMVNMICGLAFSAVVSMVITQGGWIFYKIFGIIEIALLLTIFCLAWKWPPHVHLSGQAQCNRTESTPAS
jgi:hypothetical protein